MRPFHAFHTPAFPTTHPVVQKDFGLFPRTRLWTDLVVVLVPRTNYSQIEGRGISRCTPPRCPILTNEVDSNPLRPGAPEVRTSERVALTRSADGRLLDRIPRSRHGTSLARVLLRVNRTAGLQRWEAGAQCRAAT